MTTPQLRGSLYIDGRWCEADSGRTVDVVDPATEQALCQVGYCGRAETDRAVEAAAGRFYGNTCPFRQRRVWR